MLDEGKDTQQDVTLSVVVQHPRTERAGQGGFFLRMCIAFDSAKNYPILNRTPRPKEAIANLEIIIEEISADNGTTSYDLDHEYHLQSSVDTTKPFDQVVDSRYHEIAKRSISVASGVIVTASFPALLAGPVVAALVNGFFDVLKGKPRKPEGKRGKIRIQYFKWYSFNIWWKKPGMIIQEFHIGFWPDTHPRSKEETVLYKTSVSADTGKIRLDGRMPGKGILSVKKTGKVKPEAKFCINWTKISED